MATAGFDVNRPVSPLDREAIAKIEVGHTNVTARVARVSVAWFLLALLVLPVTELVGPGAGLPAEALAKAGPWQHLAGLPDAMAERLAQSRGERAWNRLVATNRAVLERLSAFERTLEGESRVGRALRPRTQLVLSGRLGAGNERVYVGRDGWLFYRPDVEYLTGRGFLDEHQMRRRAVAASEYETPPVADPRPAILQFKRDLEARGIALVLMPTPVKPAIHSPQLARSFDTSAGEALHNPSYATFLDSIRRSGVLVFDPSGEMARRRAAGAPQYLATDTHWRPEAMQQVAEALAAFLQQHVQLPPLTLAGYQPERREARNTGDTAAMLDLPPDQTLYPPERVSLRFIVDTAGDPWRPSRDADVLLLGDSFTNMYSLATMGWGEAAGLAEQVSYALQRPIDRIVQNDNGAYATRALLAREVGGSALPAIASPAAGLPAIALATAGDRLADKRVVIWQFAARELAFGDWRVIEMR